MNGFETYLIYVAVKLHFDSDTYNYFKYGKTKANINSFERRPDKAFFYVLGKKYSKKELELFFASNIMENDAIWIGDTLEEKSKDCYLSYLKRKGKTLWPSPETKFTNLITVPRP